MSDIKDIVPEKDWRKVKIQDYPAIPTPQNVPSEHFFNGMSGAIKDLETQTYTASSKLNLVGDWKNVGVDYGEARAIRFGKVVILSGLITGGGNGTNIAFIPVQYRFSAGIKRFVVPSSSVTTQAVIEIRPNGQIVFTTGTATNVSLDGVSYIID